MNTFSCLASETVLGIMFCISALRFHCDLLVTHLSILLVVQISELKWSEEHRHKPQPRALFITLFQLMGWGVLVWNSSNNFLFRSTVPKLSGQQAAHLTLFRGMQRTEILKSTFFLFLGLLLRILTITPIPFPSKLLIPITQFVLQEKNVLQDYVTMLKKKISDSWLQLFCIRYLQTTAD